MNKTAPAIAPWSRPSDAPPLVGVKCHQTDLVVQLLLASRGAAPRAHLRIVGEDAGPLLDAGRHRIGSSFASRLVFRGQEGCEIVGLGTGDTALCQIVFYESNTLVNSKVG